MTLRQVLIVLWARRRLVFGVLALVVLGTLAVSLALPKSYRATAKLVINYKATDPVSWTMPQDLMMPSYMATQVDIIRSRSVALRVVEDFDMEHDARAIQALNVRAAREGASPKGTEGTGDVRGRLADMLSNRLEVKPSADSTTIDVSYESGDPASAAALANAFADAYLQTSVQLNAEPARRMAEWFGQQVQALRDNVVRAQQALADYQHAHGIVSLDERLDVESARLAELSNQLVLAQAQAFDSRSRQSRISDGKRMDQADSEAGAAAQREASARAALERQRVRVMEMNQQRDQLGILQGDVATSQKVLDLAMERFSQTAMAGQTNQSEAAVLDPATPPQEPSGPRVLRNVAAALFFGALLAVGVALLVEMHDRRVHGPEDLALLDLPVLTVVVAKP